MLHISMTGGRISINTRVQEKYGGDESSPITIPERIKMKMECSIIFTGDIGFDHYMSEKWKDDGLVSDEILNFLRNADHIVANVEGALIRAEDAVDVNGKGTIFHTMNPEAAKFLDKIKADIWNLANNHSMDAGLPGISSTLKIAQDFGCRTIGAGRNILEASSPVIFDEAGGIGIIGVGYMPDCVRADNVTAGCFAWDDLERIKDVIYTMKDRCRWCIVVSHAGEEFTPLPAPYTRAAYRKYLEYGADIVIGHHPHVPMNYELHDKKAIFYSLGNFIFDTDYQRVQPNTDTGILLKLTFSEHSFIFEPLATKIIRGKERIEKGMLPEIFISVPDEEYTKLFPMATKAFLSNERRRMLYLHPEKYKNYTKDQWMAYYMDDSEPVRVRSWHQDLACYAEWERACSDEEFEKSRLEGVKRYICGQLDNF